VPSFRDPETRWTLRSLFENAERPERVAAGVVWQVEARDDEDLMRPVGADSPELLSLYHSRVRSARLAAADASGPCAARAIAASLWQGEEFFLSVDAHSRFAKGWDSKLSKALAEAERLEEEEAAAAAAAAAARAGEGRSASALASRGEGSRFPFHPVLTSYPPSYEGEGPAARIPFEAEENGSAPFATLLCASRFGAEGVLRLVGKRWRRREEKTKNAASSPFAPIRSLFWAAGLSFSRAHFAVCAPTRYESDAWTRGLFWGEEHDVATRALAAGYRFWAPPPAAAVVFTRYDRSQVRGAPPVGARGSAEAAAAGKRLAAVFSGENGRGGDGDPFFSSPSEVGARYGPDVAGLWREGLGVDWRAQMIDERARRGGVDKDDEEVEFCSGDEGGGGGGGGGEDFSVL
jgi:hypothetical protein